MTIDDIRPPTAVDPEPGIPAPYVANRALPVAGTYNFRDLGGIPLADGGAVVPGRVFRSDGFQTLEEAGRSELRALGIVRIVDLRHDHELADMPSALDPGHPETVHVPIFEAASTTPQVDLARGGALDLASIYDTMVATRGERLALAASAVARSDGPVVFHCAAGKDRTGVLAALILDAVGARRDAVVADYAVTAEHLAGEWSRRMLAGQDVPALEARGVDIVQITTQSPAPLMRRLLERIDEEHGGAAAYLTANGLAPTDLTALRRTLVADA